MSSKSTEVAFYAQRDARKSVVLRANLLQFAARTLVIAHGSCMRNSMKALFDKGYFNFKTKSTLFICLKHLNIICLCKMIQVKIIGSQTDKMSDSL